MSVQSPSAAQAVGEYLQSPDDLVKVATFRKKLEKEKASIDVRLKNGVKDQIEATREGLRKLLGTRSNVQAIKDELSTVDGLCRNPQNVISTFDQISRVSIVHRNFEQVEEMVNNLTGMHSKLEVLEEMLYSDREDITGPATNLLPMHYHLNQLEAFRNQTMHQAKKATVESRATLARWFERLNKFAEEFEEYYLTLSRNILPIVRAGHTEVVVKLVKIAEIEGREDEKAIAIRLVKKAAKMDAASKFKSLQANARVLKHYRSKVTKNISESIKDAFERAYKEFENDAAGFVENLGWMYQDLIRIESDVVPCFPESWDVYKLYIREYHRTLNDMLKRLIAGKPDANTLLTLHGWLKEYKKNMKELEVPPELLEPPLLDGKEQDLIEDYLQLIINRLDQWAANLMSTEVKQFSARSEPPEQDADGLYGTQYATLLFQMVNQQVDLAMESGQGAILARVVTESNKVMRSTQEQWVKTVDAEYKRSIDKPDEVPPGLAEYCIALANDQIKSADYAEALSARLEPLVSEKYRVVISEQLNNAIDGYLDVAKKCIQVLIDIIFNDVKPAVKQLFQPAWYDGVMGQITETLRDYMADYQQFLNQSILELLVEDLLDAFIVSYLTALANTSKLKMPAAVQRIKEDITLAFQFFSTLKPAKEVEASFEIFDQILAMLEASRSLFFLSYWEFAKVHGPNVPFVEGLVKARDDFDRSAVSEVMESVKRKVKEEELKDPPEPTIMKKIAVQSTFARFLRST